MPSFASPFVLIRERASSAVVLPDASPSLSLLLTTARRGPINRLVEVVGPDDFVSVYGGDDGGDGYESVVGCFRNGASSVLINRVAHYTSIADRATLTAVAASTTLLTSGTTDTAAVKTSSNAGPFDLSQANGVSTPVEFTVSIDGDVANTATVNKTAANVLAPAVPGGAGTAGHTLVFAVNGINKTYTVPGTPPTTALDWTNSIAAQLPGVYGSVNAGAIQLFTDRQGTSAAITFVSSTGTAGADSGWTGAGTATAGTGDVADDSAVSATELAAILQAAWTGGGGTTVVANADQTLTATTVTTGASASIGVITEPTGGAGSSNIVDFAPAGVVTGASSGSPSVDSVSVIATSEGSHGNSLAVTSTRNDRLATTVTSDITGATTSFTVASTVQLRVGLQILLTDSVTGGELRAVILEIVGLTIRIASTAPTANILVANTPTVTKETFSLSFIVDGTESSAVTDLSMSPLDLSRYFGNVIGTNPLYLDARRRFYVADELPPLSNTEDPRPVDATAQALTGGVDSSPLTDVDYIGAAATFTGLYAASNTNAFSMSAVPGIETVAVHRAIVEYATIREDHVGVIEAPEGMTPDEVVTYITTTANIVSTYGVMYAGRGQILRQSTGTVEPFPVAGHILGAWARNDRNENVAEAPAGVTKGQIFGLVGIADDNPYGPKGNRDKVYPVGVNPIASFPGRGILMYGQNTLDPSSDRGAIGVRRAFIKIRKDLEVLTEFVLFRVNNEKLRRDAYTRVERYLDLQREAGIIQGDSAPEAFFIVCDETNNPPAVVSSRRFVMRIGVNIQPGVDFALIDIERDTRALEAAA